MISVLYVDDEPGLLEIGKLFLEESGQFSVDIVTSAQGALTRLNSTNYDAIISDYLMPRMDGIAFLKRVREQFGEIPFILFTGRGREEVVIEAINNGADFYLQKGGDPEAQFAELEHKLRQAVARRKADDAVRVSEEQLRSTLASMDDLVFNLDENGIFVGSHHPSRENLYTGPEQFMGRSFRDVLPEELSAQVHKVIAEVKNSGTTQLIEYSLPIQGNPVWFSAKVSPCYSSKRMFNGVTIVARNITESRHAEEALRESEKRFRELSDLLPQVVFEVDTDGNLKYTNKIAFECFGYTEDDFKKGLNIMQMLAPENLERAAAAFRAAVNGKGTMVNPAGEYIALRKDGSTFPVSIYSSPIVENCRITGLRGIIVDITERKATESALRESEERFRETANNIPGIVFRFNIHADGSQTLSYVSDRVTDILGIENSHTDMFQVLTEHIHPEDLERFFVSVKDAVQSRSPWKAEARFIKPSGEMIWLEGMSGPVLHGDELLFAGVIIDISDRKRAEEALQESEAKFRALVEYSLDGILIMDLMGNILFANREACITVDIAYDKALIEKRNVLEFVAPESREAVLRDFRNVAQGLDTYLVNYKLITRTAREIWVECIGKKIPFGDSTALFVSLRDITERKKAEDALRLANRQLGLLTGVTRHDILNKISVILGFIKVGEKKFADPDLIAYLKKMESATIAIRSQIEFTRIYQDLGSHEPQWIELDMVISRLQVPVTITLHANVQGIMVFADPMLDRVFFNLLDNSVRHGQRVTEIGMSSRKSGEDLIVIWEDNGIGILPGEKELIFERGFGKNTGFGMFLVREILSLTGITITETGEPGEGVLFEISVPKDMWRRKRDRAS